MTHPTPSGSTPAVTGTPPDLPIRHDAALDWGRYCFIIGRPRSGTTVFKSMLRSHPQIATLGEIFNETNPRSYFHFLQKTLQRDANAIFPSRSVANFTEYLRFSRDSALQRQPGNRIVALDVKYDQSHLICEPWWNIGGLPKIYSFIRDTGCRVIDIRRGDIIALIISNQIAMKTKVYHKNKLESGDAQSVKIRIDPSRLLQEMTSTAKAYERIGRHFRGYSNYLMVTYEKMFEGDRFSGHLVETIARFLDVEDRFDRVPQLVKVLDENVFSHIENAAEVKDFLNGLDKNVRIRAAAASLGKSGFHAY